MKHLIWACLILSVGAQAQIPNYRVSLVGSSYPEEVTIAINPTDPMNLVGGANLSFYYYSTNGGLNWYQSQLTSSMGVWGDPVTIFDEQGHVYYGHLSNPLNGDWLDRIVVQKSTNGGATWNDGVGIGLNGSKDQDKEWLAVDRTDSPHAGSLYMAWTEFDVYGSSSPLDSTRILFSRSTDHGATWLTPVRVSDRGGDCIDEDNTVEGAVPAVGPDGQIYLAWSGPLGIMFDQSTDGGGTFGEDRLVTSQPGGWDFAVSGIYRCNGLPMTLCDISDSPYRGTVYVMWSDQRDGHTDVFIKKSTDAGTTWSVTKRVHGDASSRHQFFPSMAIDQTTGYLYVVYYDRRQVGGDTTEVWLSKSRDGGETFEDIRISQTAFKPTSGIFFGDYIHVAAHNRKIHPIWMRMDAGILSVWTAVFEDTAGVVSVSIPESNLNFRLSQNHPNPFNPSTSITYSLSHAARIDLKVFNTLGQEIRTLFEGYQSEGHHTAVWDGRDSGGRRVASGVYFYRLGSPRGVQTKKLLLIK